MYFEEATALLRLGKKISRTDKMYSWDYIAIKDNKLCLFYKSFSGKLICKCSPKFGRGFLDDKWIEYKEN